MRAARMRASLTLLLLLPTCKRAPPGDLRYTAKNDGAEETLRAEFVDRMLWTHVRGAGPYALAPAPVAAQGTFSGFVLAADLGCRAGDDEKFCSRAQPKAWTSDEMSVFQRQMARIQTPALRRFFSQVRRNGFDTIVRQSSVVHRHKLQGWRRMYYPNTLRPCRHIVVADAQFALKAGTSDHSLIHLMAHAYDFGGKGPLGFSPTLSISPDFLRLAGFQWSPAKREWRVRGMSTSQREEFWRLFDWRNDELLKARGLPEPERTGRSRAVDRAANNFAGKFKAPSFQTLMNPWESFADWAAIVYAREAQAMAMNPELTMWFKKTVLR